MTILRHILECWWQCTRKRWKKTTVEPIKNFQNIWVHLCGWKVSQNLNYIFLNVAKLVQMMLQLEVIGVRHGLKVTKGSLMRTTGGLELTATKQRKWNKRRIQRTKKNNHYCISRHLCKKGSRATQQSHQKVF